VNRERKIVAFVALLCNFAVLAAVIVLREAGQPGDFFYKIILPTAAIMDLLIGFMLLTPETSKVLAEVKEERKDAERR
jgi:hypothetical protein